MEKVLREPASKWAKIRQKWKWSGTIGIDSGGPEEPFDALLGLFRACFNDFDQNTPRGTEKRPPFNPFWAHAGFAVVGAESQAWRTGHQVVATLDLCCREHILFAPAQWGVIWVILGSFGTIWLGSFGNHLGPFGNHLDHLGQLVPFPPVATCCMPLHVDAGCRMPA